MLIYLHVAKTAGTTMLHYLERQYKTWHLKSWWRSNWVIPADTECLFSHCPYGKPDKHFPGEHQYMTFLRDPVERIVSNYYFVLNSQDHPEHLSFLSRPFEELVRHGQQATFDNGMVRIISGRHDIGALPIREEVTRDDLERAKENLSTFAAVGMVETFDEDLAKFAKQFGWTDTEYTRYRTGRRPPVSAVRPEAVAIIRERNKYDMLLVDFARERR